MSNTIGFLNYIRLVWLDATLAHHISSKDIETVKENLYTLIEKEIQSKEVTRKTIDVLTRTWIRIPSKDKGLQEDAMKFYDEISPSKKLLLHWGMLLIRFPFFRDICYYIGLLDSIQKEIPVKKLHQKMVEKWGHRTSMIRALDRVIQSMIEWNVITKSNSFLYVNEPIEIKETDLLLWFLECLFKAENVQTMTYENLISSLTKFPFVINLPSYYVKKSKRFEYYIQGTNLETVSLKNAM